MSTVKLNCANCLILFEKNKHEISRRRAKGTSVNFFCSRSCCTAYNNKLRSNNGKHLKSHPNNKYNQKYDPSISWYLKRMKQDSRGKRCRLTSDPIAMQNHLLQIWNGKCDVSGHPIQRKDHKGRISSENPFEIASIDRIDNNLPYEIDNVRWVCLAMNMARGKLEFDEFKKFYNCWKEEIKS